MAHCTAMAAATWTKVAGSGTLRTCYVRGDADGMLGVHLSRAPWDPYPWISVVQSGSSAAAAGIRVGDCVLQVNGVDVLGQRIADVAEQIRCKWRPQRRTDADAATGSSEKGVTFLLWNARTADNINPHSLHKFTACLKSVARLLECPVCLDVVRPPAWQCCNGHVLCTACRSRSARCPICRAAFGQRSGGGGGGGGGRCLIAEQLFTLLAEAFPCDDSQTVHRTCTDAAPCSASSRQPKPASAATGSPKTTVTSSSARHSSGAVITATTQQQQQSSSSSTQQLSMRLQCPHDTGRSCAPLATAHQLLAHLRRKHGSVIAQHYCSLGDRVPVALPTASTTTTTATLAALAILKNGQTEVFLVLRHRDNSCWVWYVGDADAASGFRVRIECEAGSDGATTTAERQRERCRSTKWRGAARSLDVGRQRAGDEMMDVWSTGEGCARIASGVSTVTVEIQ